MAEDRNKDNNNKGFFAGLSASITKTVEALNLKKRPYDPWCFNQDPNKKYLGMTWQELAAEKKVEMLRIHGIQGCPEHSLEWADANVKHQPQWLDFTFAEILRCKNFNEWQASLWDVHAKLVRLAQRNEAKKENRFFGEYTALDRAIAESAEQSKKVEAIWGAEEAQRVKRELERFNKQKQIGSHPQPQPQPLPLLTRMKSLAYRTPSKPTDTSSIQRSRSFSRALALPKPLPRTPERRPQSALDRRISGNDWLRLPNDEPTASTRDRLSRSFTINRKKDPSELPSVLNKGIPQSTVHAMMTIPEAIQFVKEQLGIPLNEAVLKRRRLPVSVLFYTPAGQLLVVKEDLILGKRFKLSNLMAYVEHVVETHDVEEKLLIREVSFRPEHGNFPPLVPQAIGFIEELKGAEKIDWFSSLDSYCNLFQYWEYLRMWMLCGGPDNDIGKPIMKVQTLFSIRRGAIEKKRKPILPLTKENLLMAKESLDHLVAQNDPRAIHFVKHMQSGAGVREFNAVGLPEPVTKKAFTGAEKPFELQSKHQKLPSKAKEMVSAPRSQRSRVPLPKQNGIPSGSQDAEDPFTTHSNANVGMPAEMMNPKESGLQYHARGQDNNLAYERDPFDVYQGLDFAFSGTNKNNSVGVASQRVEPASTLLGFDFGFTSHAAPSSSTATSYAAPATEPFPDFPPSNPFSRSWTGTPGSNRNHGNQNMTVTSDQMPFGESTSRDRPKTEVQLKREEAKRRRQQLQGASGRGDPRFLQVPPRESHRAKSKPANRQLNTNEYFQGRRADWDRKVELHRRQREAESEWMGKTPEEKESAAKGFEEDDVFFPRSS